MKNKISAEQELIYRIVEQWGNALAPIECMEVWVKEYSNTVHSDLLKRNKQLELLLDYQHEILQLYKNGSSGPDLLNTEFNAAKHP